MKNKLWVDDLRSPPDDSWIWSLTSANTIDTLMLTTESFKIMSLDHDLGGDDTTRPIILWLCENPTYWPDQVHCHSANPVGREWIEKMIERYAPSKG